MKADRGALLLFDVDGTLLTTSGAGMRAMRAVCREMFGTSFTFDGVVVAGHLDPLIFSEVTARNGLKETQELHETFKRNYLERLAAELAACGPGVRPMPGIPRLLVELTQRWRTGERVTLGLLTGNYTQAVPIKLGAAGIGVERFEVTAFGDEGPDRPALVAVARDKHERMTRRRLEAGAVVVIGDTPRDVACAKAHGCRSFAVATGSYSVEQLRRAGADHAVADFSDPGPMLNLVEQLVEWQG